MKIVGPIEVLERLIEVVIPAVVEVQTILEAFAHDGLGVEPHLVVDGRRVNLEAGKGRPDASDAVRSSRLGVTGMSWNAGESCCWLRFQHEHASRGGSMDHQTIGRNAY